jgi:hypothetical protein
MRLRQTLTPPVLRITTDGFEKDNEQQTGGSLRDSDENRQQILKARQAFNGSEPQNETSIFVALVPWRSVCCD